MKLSELVKLLHADVFTKDNFQERDINYAFASDLMSDALVIIRNSPLNFSNEGIILTGICTMQSIKAAEILGMKVIVFVRAKVPTKQLLDEADFLGITLLGTNMSMFTASGLMYSAGVRGATEIDLKVYNYH